MNAIEVSHLRVVRGGRIVLPDLSCTVSSGTITGLLGPSGSGKTTLIRAIVGVQRVASGHLSVLDKPAGSPELRRLVGYVTQTPSVYGDLTVRENLAYFATMAGVASSAVAAVIETVSLGALSSSQVAQLSGGERARVSLAAALLPSPKLLVLDEPTVGLDPVLRQELWDLFHQLADQGVTFLISSHVMDEADRCQRLLLLREGAVLADATRAELLQHTQSADLEAAFLRLIQADVST
ncbi:MAG: ABC transporter ATP-binding protein [Sulfobacillus sp.]